MSAVSLRAVISELSASLRSFQTSTARFKVVKTVDAPASHAHLRATPRTLLVLDSSFNPPSRAHLALIQSALQVNASNASYYEPPDRALLLFSTHNADKVSSAASFDVRLALMILFAQDLHADIAIDIGLTTEPYYVQKAQAIMSEGPYARDLKQVHIMGFDTLTRFLGKKYYPDYTPPLSAVRPYFEAGHCLSVKLRPSETFGDVQEQKAFIDHLTNGDLEVDGADRAWARQIQINDVRADGVEGISSTRARQAAKSGLKEEIEAMCSPSVANAILLNGIYNNDDRGTKMT